MAVLRELVANACLLVLCAIALPYPNEYGPEYGEEWILFADENGTTHTVNFSVLPSDARGMILGDASFYLYSSNNEDAEVLNIPNNDTQFTSNFFNASNDIKIVTHGWLSGENTEWLQNIKDAFIRNYDFNVITVDWSELAQNPIYPWSAFGTRYVGRRLAKLINAITKTYQISGSRVHLIGHSLGAHVMGYAGMFSTEKLYRITGLDPARPLFEVPYMAADYRLERSDAEFVDIIHTCGGVLGYRKSHGHADFYPNNGKPRQPGCEGPIAVLEGCSHGRSYEFFGESIETKRGFVSYPCESWEKFEDGECRDNPTQMGYPASIDVEGDYYLYTNNQSKYALED